jgi:hypothetical protein
VLVRQQQHFFSGNASSSVIRHGNMCGASTVRRTTPERESRIVERQQRSERLERQSGDPEIHARPWYLSLQRRLDAR